MTKGCHVNWLQRNIICMKGFYPIRTRSPFQPSIEPCTSPHGMHSYERHKEPAL